MNTNATVDTPANVPAPTTPELIVHTFNAGGVCTDPELVKIPMPKGFVCVLSLACDAEGLWYYGAAAVVPGETVESPCRRGEEARAFTARGDALAAALKDAFEFFEARAKTKKAVAALEFFAERNEIALTPTGLPANIAADGSDTSGGASAPVKGEYMEIPVLKVQPSPRNHRKVFDELAIAELAESIRREGLLQPIAVREIDAAELPGLAAEMPLCPEYEIILGERRWRAHLALGVETIQAKVYRGIDSARAQVLALIENLQRVALNPIEEAEGYAALVESGLTQEAIAQRCGRSRPVVGNAMRLLKLPMEVVDCIRAGKLTTAHGVALARFAAWPKACVMIAEHAVADEATAAAIEGDIVPYEYALEQRGLVVQLGWGDAKEYRKKLGKHPAYLFLECGTAVCFDPPHWAAELAEKERRANAKREVERAEQAEAAKKSRKLVLLQDLDRDNYRRFEDPAQEKLLELVPAEKKTAAKGWGGEGKVMIVTDVALADKLKAAMQRAIKADRKRHAEDLRAKINKKLAANFSISVAANWLVYLVATNEGRSVPLNLSAEAAVTAGVKLPEALLAAREHAGDFAGEVKERVSLLDALSGLSAHDAARVLAHERLPKMLEELIEFGPSSTGGTMLRWWLGSDTLWLLEETEDGRTELLEQVKNAPWYQALLAGSLAGGNGE